MLFQLFGLVLFTAHVYGSFAAADAHLADCTYRDRSPKDFIKITLAGAVTSKVSVMDLIIEPSVRIPVTCTVVRKGWNFTTAEQQAKLAKEKKRNTIKVRKIVWAGA